MKFTTASVLTYSASKFSENAQFVCRRLHYNTFYTWTHLAKANTNAGLHAFLCTATPCMTLDSHANAGCFHTQTHCPSFPLPLSLLPPSPPSSLLPSLPPSSFPLSLLPSHPHPPTGGHLEREVSEDRGHKEIDTH